MRNYYALVVVPHPLYGVNRPPGVFGLRTVRSFSFHFSFKQQVIQRVENAKWTDNILLLQVWSRLAVLTFESGDFPTCIACCDEALKLKESKKKNGRGADGSSSNPTKNTEKYDNTYYVVWSFFQSDRTGFSNFDRMGFSPPSHLEFHTIFSRTPLEFHGNPLSSIMTPPPGIFQIFILRPPRISVILNRGDPENF